jgi:hypothetical protein
MLLEKISHYTSVDGSSRRKNRIFVQLYVVKHPSEAICPQKRAHFFLAGFVFEFFLTLSLVLKGVTPPPPLFSTVFPEPVIVNL